MSSEFRDAFELGKGVELVQSVGGVPVVVVPEGANVEDLERLLDAPRRRRGAVDLRDERSFVEYVKAHKGGGTAIFADPDARSVTAVINHHIPDGGAGAGLAGWSDYRAKLQLDRTPEWKAWLSINRQDLSQKKFVEFLEDQITDVLSPDAADLMEICMQLKGMKKVEFTGGVSLSNGDAELSYSEETTATGSKRGKVTVPERLVLKLALFRNDFPREVKARFRWRLENGAVQFTVVLHQPVKAEDDAMAEIVTRIKGSVAVDVLIGKLS